MPPEPARSSISNRSATTSPAIMQREVSPPCGQRSTVVGCWRQGKRGGGFAGTPPTGRSGAAFRPPAARSWRRERGRGGKGRGEHLALGGRSRAAARVAGEVLDLVVADRAGL